MSTVCKIAYNNPTYTVRLRDTPNLRNTQHLVYSSSSAITSLSFRSDDKEGNEDVLKMSRCKPSRVLEFTNASNPTLSMVFCHVFATKFSFDSSRVHLHLPSSISEHL
jgi:hypothetical protein